MRSLWYIDHNAQSPPFSFLFHENYLYLPYNEHLGKCEEIFDKLTLTEQQARNIELSTCEQAHTKTWFRYRARRITASRLFTLTSPGYLSH